jgi:hypothetical protein
VDARPERRAGQRALDLAGEREHLADPDDPAQPGRAHLRDRLDDDRAGRGRALARDQRQRALDPRQRLALGLDLAPDRGGVLGQDRVDPDRVVECAAAQQLANHGQAEAEIAQEDDPAQERELVAAVVAVLVLAADAGRRDQPDRVVVAQRLGRDVEDARALADRVDGALPPRGRG